ncbi:23S rRNA (adenine(2503)-C(2))-methyltransferase RlmN [Halieaceae bacterium IMCC8485]|uniref:Dual-specificity RNA methyltransferase RlmN n=1 Tax=Candidatus Seongchinamella marina TaxID=2518990 RepID=A0ABT3SQR9_9GAMM|nr:23S rRNA (adenine(2503)-C(2))-methyltransferase RlmN [Candidatus Seongchinamella marina]MBT6124919.1 23S rRNA (adenine(2503)-C(2))-methyltransferase RlmN [Halieaceae bacterium]MCX2972327.1 23S rRNA (adenine(2503)-C(2))-methyltransferase RlmN [Candidatus Seongchinamella marina]
MTSLIASTVDATQQEPEKVNLLGLPLAAMEQYFLELGEKKFRAQQVLKWIHHHGVTDIDEMSNLGKVLREKLKSVAEIKPPEIVSQHDSNDGTRKWAIRVEGGGLVEAVLIPDGKRATLCVSSQVGCSLDCSFCSTGKQGFQRDLSAAEIIGQVWLAIKSYDAFQSAKGRIVTNVVMMGMGEPLLNFDNVVAAMDLMMEDNAYGISKRRVTLSTSGVVPALDKLAKVSEVSLAVSLHAPNDALRSELVPINRKYPIAVLLQSARNYIDAQSDKKRVVTIEYTLIAGVNDQREHAQELAQLLKGYPCKINLIPFNTFDQSDYRRPSGNAVSRFWQVLVDAGYIVTVRTTRGDDIDAACGQLVGQVVDRTRRSERYRDAAQRQNNDVQSGQGQ